MTNLFITPKQLATLKEIIAQNCPTLQVKVFGSRVNFHPNNVHSGSDLDLVVVNSPQGFKLASLKEALQESNLPFVVDLFCYNDLPQSFQAEIDKNSLTIFP